MGFEKHIVEYFTPDVFVQIGVFPNEVLIRVTAHQVHPVCAKFAYVIQVKLQGFVVFVLRIRGDLAAPIKKLCYPQWYFDVAFAVGAVKTNIQIGAQFRQKMEFVIQYDVTDDPANRTLIIALIQQRQWVAWCQGIGIFGRRVQKLKVTAQSFVSAADGLGGVKIDRRTNGPLVGKSIVDGCSFQVHIHLQMFVKKRRIDAN